MSATDVITADSIRFVDQEFKSGRSRYRRYIQNSSVVHMMHMNAESFSFVKDGTKQITTFSNDSKGEQIIFKSQTDCWGIIPSKSVLTSGDDNMQNSSLMELNHSFIEWEA